MPSSTIPSGTNLAVLVGTLSREPQLRSLPSGADVLALEVTVRPDGASAESVPVAWFAAPAAAASWPAGEEVLVIGRTRRRFFRSSGATQSRTEVVASIAVPTRRTTACRRAMGSALAALAGEL